MEMETIAVSHDGVSITMLFIWMVSRGIEAIKIVSFKNDAKINKNDGDLIFMLQVDKDSAKMYSSEHPYQEINAQRRLSVVRNVQVCR